MGWKFGLKFSVKAFPDCLLSRCLGQNMLASDFLPVYISSISDHSVGGFPGARGSMIAQERSPTVSLHPSNSPVERTQPGKVLALLLWSWPVVWFGTEGLKHTSVFAVKCLGSSPGGVKTLVPFLQSELHRHLADELGLGITNTLKGVGKVLVSGSQREQASRDIEGFQSSTICLMLPHPLLPASSPHVALSPSSSEQGLRRFPLWPQKPLCVGSLPSSESSSQIHKKYC